MKKLNLLLCLLLAACGGGGGGGGSPPPCNGNQCYYKGLLTPNSAWATFGTSTGLISYLNNPFDIPPQSGGRSINYVYTLPIGESIIGKTITLNYSVDGTATFGIADSSDTPPATLALFIWANNDNGGEFGRWWCQTRPNVVLGDNQILSCVIDQTWTDAQGKPGSNNPSAFQSAMSNRFAMGVTFGGQSFAGHGFWTTTGSATFTINSYTVQ